MSTKLHPYYVTGLVEGEGSFVLSVNRNKGLRLGWECRPCFAVSMLLHNTKLLQQLSATMELGSERLYSSNKRGFVYLNVQSIDRLQNKVVPFFERWPFVGPKKIQFDIWKHGVSLKYWDLHNCPAGFRKYLALRDSMPRCASSKKAWATRMKEALKCTTTTK